MNRGARIPFCLNGETIARMREVLAAADYSELGIYHRLQAEDAVRFEPREIPRLMEMTRRKTPLDIFIRLFLLGAPVPVGAAAGAVAPMALDDWTDEGLLSADGDAVRAPLQLVPASRLLVAFDPSTRHGVVEAQPDHVHGLGMSSLNLLNGTIRREVGAALDLGTGCGIQGLVCARHSRRVISTDVNPRALNIARFNAMLNGLENILFREGSRFDPVERERFDLILMNPPFAISPDRRFWFRDGGMAGDGFVKALITEAPAHLNEGGFCQITAQWAHRRGEAWTDRLKRWLEGSGCDAWVLRMKTQNPETYAANWISETEKNSPQAYRERWRGWMAYFEASGIEAVSTGMIALRRRPSIDNDFWVTEDVESIGDGAGAAFYRGFLLRDFVRRTRDAAWLDTAFTLAPEIRIEKSLTPGMPGWALEKIILRHLGGIRFAGQLDGRMIDLLGRCDGSTPLGHLVDALAETMGTDRGDIVASVLGVMRNLVARGFVLPPGIL